MVLPDHLLRVYSEALIATLRVICFPRQEELSSYDNMLISTVLHEHSRITHEGLSDLPFFNGLVLVSSRIGHAKLSSDFPAVLHFHFYPGTFRITGERPFSLSATPQGNLGLA